MKATQEQSKPRNDAAEANLIALSGAVEKQLGSNLKLQDYLRSTIADAVASETRGTPMTSLLGGAGPKAAAVIADVTPPSVEYFWWGFHIVYPEDTVKYAIAADGVDAAVFGLLAAVIAGPAMPFIAALAANFAIEAALIPAIDQGKGIYQSMLWVAPGIIVATAIT